MDALASGLCGELVKDGAPEGMRPSGWSERA